MIARKRKKYSTHIYNAISSAAFQGAAVGATSSGAMLMFYSEIRHELGLLYLVPLPLSLILSVFLLNNMIKHYSSKLISCAPDQS